MLLWLATAASAEMYRWVDASGDVHIVSDLYDVPAEYQDAALAEAKTRSGGSLNIGNGHGEGAAPAQAPAAAEPVPAAAAEMPQPGGHDEVWWRTKSQEMHRKAEDARSAYDAEHAEDEDDAGKIYATGGHRGKRGRRGVAAAALSGNDYGPSVEELKGEAERAERDLVDFEEQARRAGVPPGWLR